MRLNSQWQGSRFPPGSYPYLDERTGFKFDPNAGGMRDRINDVKKHRKANPHIYPPDDSKYFDDGFIQDQIENYMCNLRPELCIEAPRVEYQPSRVEIPTLPCTCGATNWEPKYCQSCGGNKVQGYTCKSCGQVRS